MGPLDLLTPEPDPLFGGPPPRNAYVELHNLIAAAESASEFGPADRDRISERWGVDLAASFLAERAALYQALLDDRLDAGDLGGADRALLDHVADTLALSGADRRPVHERAFGRAVEQAVADDALSDDERRLLYTLQHTLGFDPQVTDGVYGVFARRRLVAAVARVLADGEVSPDEAEAVARAREALSAEVPADLAARIAQAAARWQLRHGSLPTVRVGIELEPDEVGHLWNLRTRWRGVSGDRLRAASERHEAALQTGRTAGLRVPGSTLSGATETGDLVVTSQRLVLRPARGLPDEVPLRLIAESFRFSNGVVVRTRGGRLVFLDLDGGEDAFHTVLLRLLRPAPPVTSGAAVEAARPSRPVRFRAAARWRDVDLEALFAENGRVRSALRDGRTAGLRIGGRGLADASVRGAVAVTDRALVLRWAGRVEEIALDPAAPPRRFLDGVLVHADGRPSVLVDAFDRTDALVEALRDVLPQVDVAGGVDAGNVRWRRVLVEEVQWVWAGPKTDARSFWQRLVSPAAPPDPGETVRALDARDAAWDGPGRASVTHSHLVFEADGSTSRTSLRTVVGVVARGRTLWVRRRRAHDWLVRFEAASDADRVRHALSGAGR